MVGMFSMRYTALISGMKSSYNILVFVRKPDHFRATSVDGRITLRSFFGQYTAHWLNLHQDRIQ
jgi:hypothetical protein